MGSMASSPFPTERHLYYALARALNRGYTPTPDSPLISVTSRPALPVELVLDIFDLAGILQINPTDVLTVYSREECNILSIGSREERLFFHSDPLSRTFLTRVRQMRLHTVSCDQGWVSEHGRGSWSWFEVCILQPAGSTNVLDNLETFELDFTKSKAPHDESGGDDEENSREDTSYSEVDISSSSEEAVIERDDRSDENQRVEVEEAIGDELGGPEASLEQLNLPSNTADGPAAPPDGTNESVPTKSRYQPKYFPTEVDKPLRWKSHHNKLASIGYMSHDGEIFGPDHDLWRYLNEGDVIAVYTCALYPGWRNNAKTGKLEFWEKFDPMGLERGLKEAQGINTEGSSSLVPREELMLRHGTDIASQLRTLGITKPIP